MDKPTIGRIVHYVAYGTPNGEYPAGKHRAAIITDVLDGDEQHVSLCILNPSGIYFDLSAPFDSLGENVVGTWHWPERE